MDDYAPHVFQVCIIYGGITGVVMLVSGMFFHTLTGKYIDEDKWTVSKQILLYVLVTIAITLANTFFYSWYWHRPIDIIHTTNMLARVVGVSIWPVSISVLYKYNRYLKENTTSAEAITNIVHEHQLSVQEKEEALPKAEAYEPPINELSTEEKRRLITITGDNKREELTVEPESIILIQSVDNYVTVYFKDVKTIRTQMLRSTLTDIAKKLAEIPFLFRCHRGYIVNIGQIKVADGNAQGYRLTMNSLNVQVPVSRSNIQQFRTLCARINDM